jgi:hypothetical protein
MVKMSQADIAIKVTADTSQAEKGLNTFAVSVEQSKSRVSSLVDGLGKFGMASIGINQVIGAFRTLKNVADDLIQTYSVQEQAEARLSATISATKNEIGMSVTELGELASSLQAVTTYGDETILGMESLFIATRKISKEVLPEATERALDMATAMGTDATSAAQKLARVLADPINNVRSLKEANIQLTEAQKSEISKLQEQGDLLGAQQVILKSVEDAYGGIAKSVAATDTGKLKQISNVWGDIKESLGGSLLDTISPALDALYSSLQKIYDFVASHTKKMSDNKTIENLLSGKYKGSLSDISDEQLQTALESTSLYYWKREAVDALEQEKAAREAVAKAAEEQRKALERLSPAQERLLIAQSGVKTGTETEILPKINEEIATKNQIQQNVTDYITQNASSSTLAQIRATKSAIAEANAQLATASTEEDVAIINEIIKSKLEKLTSLEDSINPEKIKEAEEKKEQERQKAEEAAAKTAHDARIDNVTNMVSTFSQPVTSFVSALSDLWSNVGAQFESQLDKIQKKWESFFDSLEREQTTQKDSLQMALSQGLISYDEYITARQQMDDEYANAQAEAEAEQEAIRKKADDAKRKAFEADKLNSIAQIGISAAQAIMQAWKYDPVTASILTGMITATSVAQIAAVSSKQYTPLAAGGIVSSPTYALIGEGGSKEAVLPLNEDAFKRAGISGDSGNRIVITFNFGSVYSKEELVSDVFESVEMLQRSGALPKWSYA